MVLLLSTFGSSVAADAAPWRARRRQGTTPSRRASSLVQADEWPGEPASPANVDPARLAAAMRQLCGFMPRGRPERYSAWALKYATAHGEDPFLLVALMYRMSRCKPDADTTEGVGLTSIQPRMYRHNVRGRRLTYEVPTPSGGLETREKRLEHGMFDSTVTHAEVNLEWAAALLAMFREQHALVDGHFEQEPHRHHVSHFIWGDRAKSSRAEDRILTDRRRLLSYYGVQVPELRQTWKGLEWGSPLGGGLRVVSGVPGDPREDGARAHRGVDVEACFGEPVLAMASGTVSFAGVDLPGRQSNEQMTPREIDAVPRRSLGQGGRFVCITHASEGEHWLRSCYMHLEDVLVRHGDAVEGGQPIGTVGRTGMKSSAPHLHLELQSDEQLFDARAVFDQLLLGDPPEPPRRRRRRKRVPPAPPVSEAQDVLDGR